MHASLRASFARACAQIAPRQRGYSQVERCRQSAGFLTAFLGLLYGRQEACEVDFTTTPRTKTCPWGPRVTANSAATLNPNWPRPSLPSDFAAPKEPPIQTSH